MDACAKKGARLDELDVVAAVRLLPQLQNDLVDVRHSRAVERLRAAAARTAVTPLKTASIPWRLCHSPGDCVNPQCSPPPGGLPLRGMAKAKAVPRRVSVFDAARLGFIATRLGFNAARPTRKP